MPITHPTTEPHLKGKDLRIALIQNYPGITGENAFAKILPMLPYTVLPGAKRKTFLLSQVTQALDAMASSFPAAETSTSLHRRRSQREEATAAEPSLHRRRPRKIA
jgi:hypothetical protein